MSNAEKSPEREEAERRARMLFLIESIYAQQNALFMQHRILVPELERILRWSCVHVAIGDPDFGIESRDPAYRQTFSLAAVVTGLSRRDVAEVARMRRPNIQGDGSVHRLVRILTAWRTDARYQNEAGQPVDLDLHGRAPSLQQLCRQYARDTTTRAVADILVRNGNAAWIGESEGNMKGKKLRFLDPVVTAAFSTPEDVAILTQICSDFLFSLRQTFDRAIQLRPRFREGYFNDIDAEQAEDALIEMHEEIHTFGKRCTHLLKKYRAVPGRPAVRLGVGAYSFRSAPLLLSNQQTTEGDIDE